MIATIGTPNSASEGSRRTISSVSPLCESISTRSSRRTRPRSPWTASAGCRQWLGVPVEASVAMIFWPTRPALPMPQTITFPRHERSTATARQNSPSSRSATWASARLSVKNHLPGEAELLERAQVARGSGGFHAHRLVNP